MRAVLLLALVACAHAEPVPARERGDVIAGQLMVGLTGATGIDAVLNALTLEGYQFEYLAAASDTSHLVKVTKADGATLTAEATQAVADLLKGRPGVRFVELNSLRQPR